MIIKSNFFNEKHFPYFLEKYKDIPITLFMDYYPLNVEELKLNPINLLLLHEPNDLFGLQTLALSKYGWFNGILTYNRKLLEELPNSIFFTFNGLISNDFEMYESLLKPKKYEISYLCGIKNITKGHNFRQDIYTLKDKITIPKKWYYVLEDFDHETNTRPGYVGTYSKDLSHVPKDWGDDTWGKIGLYDEPMFHIAVENCFEENWYTEKIGQAFISKTVPIYWGCPSLEDIGYDERGIIRFNSKEELLEIINSLTSEDYYDRLPYIEYNYQIALQDNFRNKLSLFLDEIIKINNI